MYNAAKVVIQWIK